MPTNKENPAEKASTEQTIAICKGTEDILKKSDYLRTIIENSRDGINLLDLKTGKYVFVNPAQIQLTGFTFEEINNISAKEAYERTHPDDRHTTIDQQKKVAAEEDVSEPVEYRWKVKSGEYRWFSDSRKLVHDEKGQVIAIVGISRDITERKKTEDALRLSEERFSKAFNLSPFAVIMTRLSDGTYVDVNDTFLKMFEFSREEVIGHTANEIKIYAKPDGRAAYLAAFKNGRVSDFEVDLKTKTGKPIKALGFAEIININGQDLTIGTLIDITERKKAEGDLKDSLSREHFLAQLVRDASVAVGVGYPDGRLGLVNDAFEKLTGYSKEELQKINWNNILTPSEYREYENAKLAEVNQTKRPIRYEKEYIRKDGSRIPIELTVHPFLDKEGNVTSYFSFIMDITDRKNVEEKLRQSEERFRIALKNAPVSVAVQDCELRYIWAYNQKTANPEQILGRLDSEIFTHEEAAHLDVIKRRVLKEGIELREQMWFNRPSVPIFLDVTWSPLYDSKGQIIGVSSATIDLTNMKRAEIALQESEQRWSTMLSSIGDAVIATDTSGKTMFMNRVAEELTGWTLSESSQKPVKEVFNIVNEQTRLEVENPIAKVLREGIVVGLANHTVLIRKDGSEIPIDDSGAPIKDKDGKTTGVVLIF